MLLKEKIKDLKKKKDALIIAHYYQPDEIQEIADFVGDSLELSKIARDCKQSLIVFCGVSFMGGSAKLIAPDKKVLLPVKDAYCEMATMIGKETIKKLKKAHPKAKVVTYINSTVEAKTLTDICCTSSNAVDVVNSIKEDEIIFLPDKNLAGFVQKKTNKKIITDFGYCPVHDRVNVEDIMKMKKKHPNALLLVHPECKREVEEMADFCSSTSGIIKFVGQRDENEFIIGTEQGILYKLKELYPQKRFYMAKDNFVCWDMKKISLEDLYNSLKDEKYEVIIDKATLKKASTCIHKMLSL
ncbi:MAG: quinolinate synthase NadA [Bacillota bacterium]